MRPKQEEVEDEEMEDDEATDEEVEQMQPQQPVRHAGRPRKEEQVAQPKAQDQWGLGEVAKTTEVVFVDNKTGKAYNKEAVTVLILNKLGEIVDLLQ